METTDDHDGLVWCEDAGKWVAACECGPHEECPEHWLNCKLDEEVAR
jgi:hypothetical protein